MQSYLFLLSVLSFVGGALAAINATIPFEYPLYKQVFDFLPLSVK
jgi:hypothetical protein